MYARPIRLFYTPMPAFAAPVRVKRRLERIVVHVLG